MASSFRHILARTWVQLALVVLLASAVRTTYLVQSADNPTFTQPIIDAATYDQRARELAFEGAPSEEIFWQAPLYPVFLAGVYRLTGGSIVAAHWIQALLGCVTCALVFLLGHRVFGATAGVIAGAVYALYGPAIFFEAELLSVGSASLLAAGLLLLVLRVAERPGRWSPAVLGALSAAAVLVRTTFLPFLVLVTVWLAVHWSRRGHVRRTVAVRLLLILAGWLIIAAPAAEWSRRLTGRVVLVPPSGGINLYLGNNPDFERTVNARPGREWSALRALPEEAGHGGDVMIRQAWYVAEVRRFAVEQPGRFAAGLLRKGLHLVGSRELARNVDVYLMSEWSPLLRALVGKIGPFGFPFGVLLPLALLGLIARWRAVPVPVKLFLLLFSLTIVVFFVSARFRLVLVPMLAVLAAGGVLQLTAWFDARRWRPIGAALLGGAGVVVLVTAPGPFAQERVDLEPELHYAVGYGHYRAERWTVAQEHLARAVALRPDYPEAHNILGIALYRQNRLRGAVEHFRTAARLDPAFPDVQSSLRVVAEDRAANLAEAWRLATASGPRQRDGARAVYHANRAAALTVEPDPCLMGVRAAAFAAADEAERAASLAAAALEALKGRAVFGGSCFEPIAEFEARLRAIRDGGSPGN